VVKGGAVLRDEMKVEKAAAAFLEHQEELRRKNRELAGA
jgi:hypothetical protein